jgi:hypothetical protein
VKNPCKNCLKLPICIGQSNPNCYDLHQYIEELIKEYKADDKHLTEQTLHKAFEKMRKTLPNLL